MEPTTTQSIPLPPMRIALASIEPSKTNPRRHFDKAAMDGLTENVRRLDILQPILLRPNGGPGKYELVAGERRFRAAKAAGLTDIPATVRELSDSEVLEIQVVENVQRKDLLPLEEALGYDRLLKCEPKGVDVVIGVKWTVDTIAAKVGKSKAYVYAKLKLLALCPEARKALEEEKISESIALLIARIGHHDTQRQALKDVLGRGGDDPMSYRDAHRHILEEYTLALKSAVFDIKDAELVPKAGACGPCPKRTGNQVDLFGDVKSADVCTDPKCFGDKGIAHHAKAAKALEAKGEKIVYGEEAKKAFPDWDSPRDWQCDRLVDRYVPMNGHAYVGNRQMPVRQLLGEDYKPLLLQHPGTGQIIEVTTPQAIAAAGKRSSSAKKASVSKPKASGPKVPDIDDVLTERLAALIHKKAPKQFGKAWLLFLAQELVAHLSTRNLDAVAVAWGWKSSAFRSANYGPKKLPPEASKLGDRDLVLLMLHIVFAIGPYTRGPVLKQFGIVEARIREEIIEERKAARQAKAAAPAKEIRSGHYIKPMTEKTPAAKKAKAPPAKKGRAKPRFMKPMTPSAELAAIVGTAAQPRTEVTSKVWGYIKKHGLQDKVNRLMVNPDAKLGAVFGGTKPISMFDMTQKIAKHLS